jgi:hypothetical protein
MDGCTATVQGRLTLVTVPGRAVALYAGTMRFGVYTSQGAGPWHRSAAACTAALKEKEGGVRATAGRRMVGGVWWA